MWSGKAVGQRVLICHGTGRVVTAFQKIYHVESTSCEKWRFGARGPGRESVGRSGKVPGYFGKGETVMDEPIIIIILPPDTWL